MSSFGIAHRACDVQRAAPQDFKAIHRARNLSPKASGCQPVLNTMRSKMRGLSPVIQCSIIADGALTKKLERNPTRMREFDRRF